MLKMIHIYRYAVCNCFILSGEGKKALEIDISRGLNLCHSDMPQITRGGEKALEIIDIRWGWTPCRSDMPQIIRGGEKALN